jgi:uncharacterized protein (UPF0261 family)
VETHNGQVKLLTAMPEQRTSTPQRVTDNAPIFDIAGRVNFLLPSADVTDWELKACQSWK